MKRARLRGRTRSGRLVALDAYVTTCLGGLLRGTDPVLDPASPLLDVGIGERPDTTLELARACRRVSCGLRIIGVDADQRRVAAAQSNHPQEQFACCDALAEGTREVLGRPGARLVRAMNVLRGLSPLQARAGLRRLGDLLMPGGVLLEGTCDRTGSSLCAHVMNKQASGELKRSALLFSTDFSRGCGPWMFRDELPSDLRRSCYRGHPLHSLLAEWHQSFLRHRGITDIRARFAASVAGLADDQGIRMVHARMMPGLVIWEPAGGVPEG
ncbi:MAG: class I SAM-dependent methyltransferase [Myxococcales bacterium]|nr:class I SAM-dependent methyltransferase [Myxococcales bacterium]MDD9965399.1 class I SAM-dependent methyltransferase [Myxococcales bacterium]